MIYNRTGDHTASTHPTKLSCPADQKALESPQEIFSQESLFRFDFTGQEEIGNHAVVNAANPGTKDADSIIGLVGDTNAHHDALFSAGLEDMSNMGIDKNYYGMGQFYSTATMSPFHSIDMSSFDFFDDP